MHLERTIEHISSLLKISYLLFFIVLLVSCKQYDLYTFSGYNNEIEMRINNDSTFVYSAYLVNIYNDTLYGTWEIKNRILSLKVKKPTMHDYYEGDFIVEEYVVPNSKCFKLELHFYDWDPALGNIHINDTLIRWSDFKNGLIIELPSGEDTLKFSCTGCPPLEYIIKKKQANYFKVYIPQLSQAPNWTLFDFCTKYKKTPFRITPLEQKEFILKRKWFPDQSRIK